MQNTLNSQREVGIIAYWKKDKNDTYNCYHYFYIPKPCKRLLRHSMRKLVIKEDSSARLFQVIYTSCDDELFLFFEERV